MAVEVFKSISYQVDFGGLCFFKKLVHFIQVTTVQFLPASQTSTAVSIPQSIRYHGFSTSCSESSFIPFPLKCFLHSLCMLPDFKMGLLNSMNNSCGALAGVAVSSQTTLRRRGGLASVRQPFLHYGDHWSPHERQPGLRNTHSPPPWPTPTLTTTLFVSASEGLIFRLQKLNIYFKSLTGRGNLVYCSVILPSRDDTCFP